MQKNLEQQIKNICFWAFGGFFWYLVISFFLLSDYPIQEQTFNHKKAYEVIKDALGLVAAFVAPAIAVILFRDWREEHASVKNERVSLEVQDLLKTTIASLETFMRNHGDYDLVQIDIKLHFQNIRTLDRLEKEITTHNDLAVNYVTKLNEINDLIFKCGMLWTQHLAASTNQDSSGDKWEISDKILRNVGKLKKLFAELGLLKINPK